MDKISKWLFTYIAVCGLVIFPCFILEESIQMATFGTWPASDARDWSLVVVGLDTIETINTTMKIVNYSLGWVQPISFFAYRAYAKATDFYISGMEAKIFAHQPSALVGREVDVRVSLAGMNVQRVRDCFLYIGQRASFLFKSKQNSKWARVRGHVTIMEDGTVLITDNLIGPVRE